MPDPKEIRILTIDSELHACPDCGYTLGFHLSFTSAGTVRESPVRSTRDVFRVILICPDCGARYDVGWRVPLAEFGNRFLKTTAPAKTCVPHGSPADCLPALPHHEEELPE